MITRERFIELYTWSIALIAIAVTLTILVGGILIWLAMA
jgi:hypothetical protein